MPDTETECPVRNNIYPITHRKCAHCGGGSGHHVSTNAGTLAKSLKNVAFDDKYFVFSDKRVLSKRGAEEIARIMRGERKKYF